MRKTAFQFSIRNLILFSTLLSLVLAVGVSWIEYQRRESRWQKKVTSRLEYIQIDQSLSDYVGSNGNLQRLPGSIDEAEAIVFTLGGHFAFSANRLTDEDQDGSLEYRSYDGKYVFALVEGKIMLRSIRTGKVYDPLDSYPDEAP